MSTIEQHTGNYFIGMKVEVKIPLPNTKVFRDWAIINEIDEDLVSLQLSRDILPEGVNLRVGQVLTITGQSGGNTRTYRAFIVSKGYEQDLLLRFTSETIANELREFYRVDAFLPIKFHRLNDQNPVNVKQQWEAHLKQRREDDATRERSRLDAKRARLRAEERAKELKILEGFFLVDPVALSQDTPQEELPDSPYYESWGDVTALAVNISGGGIKIFTNEKFSMDELIMLEAYVPSSECIVDIVARVVLTNYSNITEDNKSQICTAMQFVLINESASSAINSHISSIQLKRIRQFKGFNDVVPTADNVSSSSNNHYAYIDSIAAGEKTEPQSKRYKPSLRQILLTILFVAVVWLLCSQIYSYGVKHHDKQIQEIFEKGLKSGG